MTSNQGGERALTAFMSSSITPTKASDEATFPAAAGWGPRFQSTLAFPANQADENGVWVGLRGRRVSHLSIAFEAKSGRKA